VSVTISIGVAERQAEHRNPEEVLKSADQALYSAKGAGVTVSWCMGNNRSAVLYARRDHAILYGQLMTLCLVKVVRLHC
jgi:GGDEF domain-containing protein